MKFDTAKAKENETKYLVPPTWEYMDAFIKEIGISIYHFERYYGLAFNHLAKVRCGLKPLGKSYWHIFYERIKPNYGMGFYEQKNTPKKILKSIPNVAHQSANDASNSASVAHIHDNHTRLTTVK